MRAFIYSIRNVCYR